MSNIIRLNETAPNDEWIIMSNQGTDSFLELLIAAADNFEKTEQQKKLISFLKDQKDINAVAAGTAGFDLDEMPWQKSTLKEDVEFLTRVTEEAKRERTIRILPYEVNTAIVFPWLERFAFLINQMTEENLHVKPELESGDKMIETERLLLRKYTMNDFEALYEILSDSETMQHYPAPFDEDRTKGWITWNLDNYEKYGFGRWAVVLKETGEFIGDCGITIQNIDGEMLPEIGYHIHKRYWRRGFAKEAARAVRDWVFQNTHYDTLYSYMKYTNVGSYSTAIANGMKKVKEYPDPKNTISYAYAITRSEWEAMKR